MLCTLLKKPLIRHFIVSGNGIIGKLTNTFGCKSSAFTICCYTSNWMAPGKNRVTAISSEIFKYVKIHPNFASRPVRCEKMFLCCFSLKAGRKDLTNRPKVLSPHPPPPSCFLPGSTRFLISRVSRFSIFQEERSNWGGENFKPVCQVFSSCFEGKTTTSFQITQVGSQSLGGFWHTWKFQLKWRLRDSWILARSYSIVQ